VVSRRPGQPVRRSLSTLPRRHHGPSRPRSGQDNDGRFDAPAHAPWRGLRLRAGPGAIGAPVLGQSGTCGGDDRFPDRPDSSFARPVTCSRSQCMGGAGHALNPQRPRSLAKSCGSRSQQRDADLFAIAQLRSFIKCDSGKGQGQRRISFVPTNGLARSDDTDARWEARRCFSRSDRSTQRRESIRKCSIQLAAVPRANRPSVQLLRPVGRPGSRQPEAAARQARCVAPRQVVAI
jgi:hypothetical protein